MYYTIYKANPKNTGVAGSFRVSTREKNGHTQPILFVEFLKQKSWDAARKVGKFDTDTKKSIILSANEAGELLYSIKNKVPWQGYHKSETSQTNLKFTVWNKIFSVGQQGAKDYWSGTKTCWGFSYFSDGVSCSIPLISGEAEVIAILLEHYIKESLICAATAFNQV